MTKNFFLWILLLSFGILLNIYSVFAAEKPLYDAQGKRDPFSPLLTSTSTVAAGLVGIETAEEIRVEGIVHDPSGSFVIANGQVLKQGESIGGVKVAKIRKDGVVFLINGVETFKPIYQSDTDA